MIDRRTFMAALMPGLVLLPACASSGGSSGGSRRSPNVITEEELAEYTQDDLHEAIRRMRPNWLRRRGAGTNNSVSPVQVYINGARMGDTNALRGVNSTDVVRIEYLSGPDATTRFGTGNGGGAILVTTR